MKTGTFLLSMFVQTITVKSIQVSRRGGKQKVITILSNFQAIN